MPIVSNDDLAFDVVHTTLSFGTSPRKSHHITQDVVSWLGDIGAVSGTITVFCLHTSASLTIQENADPTVQEDLLNYLDDIAPENRPYIHSLEGPDDMPAHLKTMLTSVSLTIPVDDCRLCLGQWQGIFLLEHRSHRHHRDIRLTFTGLVRNR